VLYSTTHPFFFFFLPFGRIYYSGAKVATETAPHQLTLSDASIHVVNVCPIDAVREDAFSFTYPCLSFLVLRLPSCHFQVESIDRSANFFSFLFFLFSFFFGPTPIEDKRFFYVTRQTSHGLWQTKRNKKNNHEIKKKEKRDVSDQIAHCFIIFFFFLDVISCQLCVMDTGRPVFNVYNTSHSCQHNKCYIVNFYTQQMFLAIERQTNAFMLFFFSTFLITH
jgi:hypothetical protein